MSRLYRIFLAAFFCFAAFYSNAYTYTQQGVYSNFLVDGDKLVFAQSDRTLTVLSIETGEVLLRVKNREFSGTLKRVSQGILMLQYSSVALLNPTNYTTIWETTTATAP